MHCGRQEPIERIYPRHAIARIVRMYISSVCFIVTALGVAASSSCTMRIVDPCLDRAVVRLQNSSDDDVYVGFYVSGHRPTEFESVYIPANGTITKELYAIPRDTIAYVGVSQKPVQEDTIPAVKSAIRSRFRTMQEAVRHTNLFEVILVDGTLTLQYATQ
jgi:hypothetical protein